VPQQGDMILIDRILGYDEISVRVALEVRNRPLWPERDALPAAIGIEYMAQAIAAFSNLRKPRVSAGKPGPGLLLGTRDFKSASPAYRVGAILAVHAKVVTMDEHVGVFSCRIEESGREIASATISVFDPGERDMGPKSP